MGTGSSGGNATDGNDIPSPRPFADDEDEIENYTEKNVGYGAMGSHTTGMEKNKGTFNRDPRGGMFELKKYIKKVLREQAYGHATLTTQGIPNQSRAIVGTDEYPFTARPKSRLPGVQEDTMSDEEWEDAKEAERLANHPERDKIRKAQQMIDKERGPSYDEVYLKDRFGKEFPGVYTEMDGPRLEVYPDHEIDAPYKPTRTSQKLNFKLVDGEISFTYAFGYDRTFNLLKKVLPELPSPGSTGIAGMSSINASSEKAEWGPTPIPVSMEQVKELIQAMKDGLSAESGAQAAFDDPERGGGFTQLGLGRGAGSSTYNLQEQSTETIARRRLGAQRVIAQAAIDDIENARDAALAAAGEGKAQGTQAISQQEEQLYNLNQQVMAKDQEHSQAETQLIDVKTRFQEMPAEPQFEEEKKKLLEQIYELKDKVNTLSKEINNLRTQRNELNQAKLDAISAQTSAPSVTGEFDQSLRDARKALTQVGKGEEEETAAPVAETLLRQYEKERINVNLMEQMDSYNETTRGSLEKFFKMFEAGDTNEEVIQHYAKNGIQIPEQFISKVKKQFEQYKKLKLELGFTEQEAKDFKKSVIPQEDTKKLSTRIFKK